MNENHDTVEAMNREKALAANDALAANARHKNFDEDLEQRRREMVDVEEARRKTEEAQEEGNALFSKGLAGLPKVEQFIVLATYGIGHPTLTTKQIRARIKEVHNINLAAQVISHRLRRATWYIAGAMGTHPEKVEKVLKAHHQAVKIAEADLARGPSEKSVQDIEKYSTARQAAEEAVKSDPE